MKSRVALTVVWLAGFVAALVMLRQYTLCSGDGCVPPMLPSQLVDTAKPLVAFFGGYLAVILAFWFTRPFPPAKAEHGDTVRFGIALVCTVIFIGVVLYISGRGLWMSDPTITVDQLVGDAVKAAAYMSFLVAPVNAYYFGSKSSG